jgi:hypothetical protein
LRWEHFGFKPYAFFTEAFPWVCFKIDEADLNEIDCLWDTWRKPDGTTLSTIGYSDEIATDCDAKRHAFRRKSAVRGVGAKRRWNFVHNLMDLVVASQVIISWFF